MNNYKTKEIEIDQSDEANWLNWRSKGIGASESSVLMGSLPFIWNDCLQLWKLKTGMVESDFEMNDAMRQGKALEPIAREKYIEATETTVVAKCFELVDFPFIKASLDGITEDGKHIVEIKCSGLPTWQKAKKGFVSPYYYSQIMQQLAVANAESAHYWMYRKEQGGILINVPRNENYIEELIRRSVIFWECVESKKPCLPRMLGIDMFKDSDPYEGGNMEVELVKVFKN